MSYKYKLIVMLGVDFCEKILYNVVYKGAVAVSPEISGFYL